MELNLKKVHDYTRVPGSTEVRLVGTHAAVSISANGCPPVFIQDGNFYYANGERVSMPLPLELQAEVDKMTDAAKKECGIYEEPDRVEQDGWTCKDCGEKMPLKKKGLHIAGHKRGKK